MEALDLPIGLRSVRAGLLRSDAQVGARIAPQMGLVAAAVVADHARHGDTPAGEPGDRVLEDRGRSLLRLVVVSLDVGDTGVVVDNGVQVAGAYQRLAVLALGYAGSCRCRSTVLLALLATDVAPTTAVGHLAELLHIDVEQVTGLLVLVAADRLAGCSAD
jgi:hypothetical protein